MAKTYRYFVSYTTRISTVRTFGDVVLVYDEPMNTEDMIERAKKDIENLIVGALTDSIHILFFKRIKGNR